ncbi:hypothetical protein [Phenylobacterium sp.]|uniref:hypothetical protein n=1 Tax=Phenylobacterium sp. TaxID=1871053 RepID=UPI0025FD5791|nr:hypothetical protein [Phenylobacterium sp.]
MSGIERLQARAKARPVRTASSALVILALVAFLALSAALELTGDGQHPAIDGQPQPSAAR